MWLVLRFNFREEGIKSWPNTEVQVTTGQDERVRQVTSDERLSSLIETGEGRTKREQVESTGAGR